MLGNILEEHWGADIYAQHWPNAEKAILAIDEWANKEGKCPALVKMCKRGKKLVGQSRNDPKLDRAMANTEILALAQTWCVNL